VYACATYSGSTAQLPKWHDIKVIHFHITAKAYFSCPFFFKWWRAPQQTLRTHRSLEASCATLWWRWRRWWLFFIHFLIMEHRWNEIDRGKTYPSATSSTTNPTRTDLGSNPGLRGGRPWHGFFVSLVRRLNGRRKDKDTVSYAVTGYFQGFGRRHTADFYFTFSSVVTQVTQGHRQLTIAAIDH
jgi:hypothetical protein